MEKEMNYLSLGILGSSCTDKELTYEDDIKSVLNNVPAINYLKIVTGGYRGVAELFIKTARDLISTNGKYKKVIAYGILYDGYRNDPVYNSLINSPNEFNDFVITTNTIGERAQIIIEMSDYIVAFPGNTGTLHEILQTIEHIKYGLDYNNKENFKRLYIHSYWKNTLLRIVSNDLFGYLNFFDSNCSNIIKFFPKSYIHNNKSLLTAPQRNNENDFFYVDFLNQINILFKSQYYVDYKDISYLEGIDIAIRISKDGIIDNVGLFVETYGTDEYINLLKKYFKTYKSILVSDDLSLIRDKTRFKNYLLNNPETVKSNVTYRKECNYNFIGKNQSSIDIWISFLSDEKVGKTAIKYEIDFEVFDYKIEIVSFLLLAIELPNIFIDKLINKLDILLFQESTQHLLNLLIQDINRNAKKSAIAAVISRNMSHNIGSHTLSKLNSKQLIENIEPQFKGTKDIYDEYRKKYLDYFKVNGEYPVNEKDEEFSTEGKIASFNSYLQSRMDFVADLVTSTPSLENSILFEDVLKKFEKNVLLNNTISGVNDLIVNLKYDEECKKKLVSFPNDQLGCQAFYIILENIIRNCAKHGSYKKNSNKNNNLRECQITIEIEDYAADKQYYEVKIYDNDDDGRENIKLSDIVDQRNKAINKPILDETGSLRHGDWGTLEMKIAAAYLRKIESYKIDEKQYNANENNKEYLLEAITKIENKKTKGFGYKFLLMKPKEILIVDFRDNNVLSSFKEQLNQFKNQGIWIKKGIDLFPNGKYCGEVFNHDFLIVIPKDIKDIAKLRDEAIKNFLPMRVLIVADEGCNIKRKFYGKCSIIELTKKLEEEKTTEKPLLEYAWVCWSKHLNEFYEKGIKIKNDKVISNQIVLKAEYTNHSWVDDINYDFYESCSSRSKMINDDNNNNGIVNEALNCSFYRKRIPLCESIYSKVAILDERIQSNAYNLKYKPVNTNKEIPFYEVFKRMRIHIPDIKKDLNLSQQSFNKIFKDDVVKWINNLDNSEKLDFLVMHLGLIEKLLDDPNNKDSSEIKKYIDKLRVQNTDLKIIIVSGRGEPHNLPDNELFMNYSMIPIYLFEYRSKYHFNKLLFSGRRKYEK